MIARKSALIVATEIINGGLAYVGLFFIARYMDPTDYGIVAFAMSFVTLFFIFSRLGYNEAHVKKISEGKKLGICNGTFFTTKIVLIMISSILIVLFIFIWKNIIGRGFESSEQEIAIYIMLGYFISNQLAESINFTFKARKEIAKVRVSLLLSTIVRVLLTIYVVIMGYGALVLALSYVVGEIVHFLFSLYLFRNYPVFKPTRNCFKEYSAFAFPLIFVVASITIMTNIDKILIQLFWSAEDVAYYFAAFRLTHFINIFTISIGVLIFPTFSSLNSNNNIQGIRQLTYKSERYLSLIVVPMVFGIVTLAEPATNILLSKWMPVIPILQILPFFVLFAALEKPYESQLIGMNHPKLARNRILIMVSLNLLLNIILIPKDITSLGLKLVGLGARGAAIATVVAYLVGLIYSRLMARKLTGIKGNPKILLHFLAAIIMSGILYVILYRLNFIVYIERWYHLLFFSFLGVVIYAFVLFLIRELKRDDVEFFMEALNIKKMFSYIKHELKIK